MMLLLWAISLTARGDLASQVVRLEPGWNAVFIEVTPEDKDCDKVFDGIPIKSVWSWNRKIPIQQFTRNPDDLLAKPTDWRIYFPKEEARSFLSDLFTIEGGRPYLIEFGGESPIDLTLTGTPETRGTEWLSNSFNLVGFYIDAEKAPTFKNFFAHDPNLANQAVYRVDRTGKSVLANQSDSLRRGEAYWVFAKGPSNYRGPVAVDADPVAGLDFGESVDESYIVLKNATSTPKTITLELQAADAGSGEKSAAAPSGNVALSFKRTLAWAPLEGPLTFTVSPKSEERLELAVRRADMTSALKSAGPGSFAGVVQLRDGQGALYRLPVKAVADTTPAGLWVGEAILDSVSEAYKPSDLTPTAAASPFGFRVILHIDELGNARLLQKAYLMQVQATMDNTQDPPVVIDPARYVILTRDDLVPQYSGVSLRDGKVVGRRITTPVFSFTTPVAMTGGFQPGQTLTGQINVPFTDPLNPFLHRFHPDHNNLDERFENALPEGVESFTFRRTVKLGFSNQDPDDLGLPTWGYRVIGGTYSEDITGVHKRTIRVQGTFKLTKVSTVGVLNDNQP